MLSCLAMTITHTGTYIFRPKEPRGNMYTWHWFANTNTENINKYSDLWTLAKLKTEHSDQFRKGKPMADFSIYSKKYLCNSCIVLTNKATTPRRLGVLGGGRGGGGSAVCFNAHNITMNYKRTATPLTVSVTGQHLQWWNKGFQVNGAQHPVTPGNYSETSQHSLTLKIQATCRLKTNIIMSKSCCTQMHNFQTGP